MPHGFVYYCRVDLELLDRVDMELLVCEVLNSFDRCMKYNAGKHCPYWDVTMMGAAFTILIRSVHSTFSNE